MFKVPNNEWDTFDKIVKEWEKRTRLTMEYDYTNAIYQRDVNNYIAIFDDGKIERKGGSVKEAKVIDNDLPIVSDAYKLSSKYDHALYNDEILTDKVYRVFASRSHNDGILYKCKHDKNPEKFASCPDHCRIVNGNIQEMKTPKWLDRKWYIDEAWKRINSFKGE